VSLKRLKALTITPVQKRIRKEAAAAVAPMLIGTLVLVYLITRSR
jgi:hypothetical protein